MTRAAAPDAAFEHRSFGAPGAERVVVLLRAGGAALNDPRPDVTAHRDARILAVALDLGDIDDPAAYRGTTPAEATARALTSLVLEQGRGRPVGLVGVGIAGALAILMAGDLGATVDRLALVAVPRPESELAGDEIGDLLGGIEAKTLLLNGNADPGASLAAAKWFHERLPSSRIEMVPKTDDPQHRLDLAEVWDRVLSHLAPGTKR